MMARQQREDFTELPILGTFYDSFQDNLCGLDAKVN